MVTYQILLKLSHRVKGYDTTIHTKLNVSTMTIENCIWEKMTSNILTRARRVMWFSYLQYTISLKPPDYTISLADSFCIKID